MQNYFGLPVWTDKDEKELTSLLQKKEKVEECASFLKAIGSNLRRIAYKVEEQDSDISEFKMEPILSEEPKTKITIIVRGNWCPCTK